MIVRAGYTTDLRDDYRDLVDPPGRGNMKEETYEAKLETLWEGKEAKSRQSPDPLGCKVTEIKATLNGGSPSVYMDTAAFLLWLTKECQARSKTQDALYIVSFETTSFIRSCMWDVMLNDPKKMARISPALWLGDSWTAYGWKQARAINLYSVSGAKAEGISLGRWLLAFGIPTKEVAKVKGNAEVMLNCITHVEKAMHLGMAKV